MPSDICCFVAFSSMMKETTEWGLQKRQLILSRHTDVAFTFDAVQDAIGRTQTRTSKMQIKMFKLSFVF